MSANSHTTKTTVFFQMYTQNCWMCYAEDFWLGLKKIYSIAKHGLHILRIDLEDWKEGKHWAEYYFSLEGPSRHYTIHLRHFSGELADAMANSTDTPFSTKDRNDNKHRNANCPRNYTGTEKPWF